MKAKKKNIIKMPHVIVKDMNFCAMMKLETQLMSLLSAKTIKYDIVNPINGS
jgi:hypothetical protein